MKHDERDAIQRLCDNATPGPWRRSNGGFGVLSDHHEASGWICQIINVTPHDNASFIAAARTTIPDLLADLAAAERERDCLTAEVARLRTAYDHFIDGNHQTAQIAKSYLAERDSLRAQLAATEKLVDWWQDQVSQEKRHTETTLAESCLALSHENDQLRDELDEAKAKLVTLTADLERVTEELDEAILETQFRPTLAEFHEWVAKCARYEAVVQASVAMRLADRDVPAGESIAELEVTACAAAARTSRALVLWRTAVDALPGHDADSPVQHGYRCTDKTCTGCWMDQDGALYKGVRRAGMICADGESVSERILRYLTVHPCRTRVLYAAIGLDERRCGDDLSKLIDAGKVTVDTDWTLRVRGPDAGEVAK